MSNEIYDLTTEMYLTFQREGEILLNESGYKIGQTIYLEGMYEATIDYAMGHLESKIIDSVVVNMASSMYSRFRPDADLPSSVSIISIPCALSNFTSEIKL
jgi:hypothetical protein